MSCGGVVNTITPTDAVQFCTELVRKADMDRYLASLFAPEDKRAHLMALYAFSTEVARVREITTETMTGEIRLQWWRDTIEHIYAGSVPDHPVALALSAAIEAGNLSKSGFLNLIDARVFDLYDDVMPSVDALEGYLGETSSSVIQMAALILAGPAGQTAADAAGHAGVAYGMTGLMRALPIHRARGQCFIPLDVLTRCDLTGADILSGKQTTSVRLALREMRQLAAGHLVEARAHSVVMPGAALPAFLPASLVGIYLKRLERMGPSALRKVAEVQQIRRQWRLLMAALRHKF